MPTVKVLSLQQPWAQLIFTPANEPKLFNPELKGLEGYCKAIETRSWKTDYRGRLYIHASETYHGGIRMIMDKHLFRSYVEEPLYRGGIIGSVHLYDIVPTASIKEIIRPLEREFGDYTDGRWAWMLKDPVLLANPIKAKGALSLWKFNLTESHA